MGKIKYFIWLLVIFSLFVFVRNRHISGRDYVYILFRETYSPNLIQDIFCLVPSKIRNNYKTVILEAHKNFELLCVIDNSSVIKSKYVLINSDTGFRFIRAYPSSILRKNSANPKDDREEWDPTEVIDTNSFNTYFLLFEKNLSKEKIIEKYIQFLADPLKKEKFVKIQSKEDIRNLLETHPPDNKDLLIMLGYNIIDINTVRLDEQYHYYWIYNFGIVKFKFQQFENGMIKEVESEIVGLLGNEIPVCC